MGNLPLVRGTPAFVAGVFSGNARTGGVYGVSPFTGWDSPVGTVECWIKRSGATAVQIVVGNGSGAISFGVESGGGITGRPSNAASNINGANVTGTLNDGAWHHIAMVCDTTLASLYQDGVRMYTMASTNGFYWGTAVATVGGHGPTTGFDYTGAIDEVRISKVARYTGATYTVPTAAFTDDSDTLSLYRLEADGFDSHVPPASIAVPMTALASGVVASNTPFGGLLIPGSAVQKKAFEGGYIYTPPVNGQHWPRGDYAPQGV